MVSRNDDGTYTVVTHDGETICGVSRAEMRVQKILTKVFMGITGTHLTF